MREVETDHVVKQSFLQFMNAENGIFISTVNLAELIPTEDLGDNVSDMFQQLGGKYETMVFEVNEFGEQESGEQYRHGKISEAMGKHKEIVKEYIAKGYRLKKAMG